MQVSTCLAGSYHERTKAMSHLDPNCKMGELDLEPEVCRFYQNALATLQTRGVPHMVGGAFALLHYTGVSRHTKDFDIFARESDALHSLQALSEVGYRTEMVSTAWLAKA